MDIPMNDYPDHGHFNLSGTAVWYRAAMRQPGAPTRNPSGQAGFTGIWSQIPVWKPKIMILRVPPTFFDPLFHVGKPFHEFNYPLI